MREAPDRVRDTQARDVSIGPRLEAGRAEDQSTADLGEAEGQERSDECQ
jgi:hypothetical protein